MGKRKGKIPRNKGKPCSVAMTSAIRIGNASSISFLVVPALTAVPLPATIVLLSTPSDTSPRLASLGVTSLAASATSTPFGNATIAGARKASGVGSPKRSKTRMRSGSSSIALRSGPTHPQPGRKKNPDGSGGQDEQALGRSRGGFGTKIHAAVTPLGHAAELELTGAEASDCKHLCGLIEGHEPDAVLADKGYDSGENREAIEAMGADPCVPGRKNRKEQIEYDRHLYKERNVVERYFGKLKQWRRVATRYDKKARNYLGFVWIASIDISLE